MASTREERLQMRQRGAGTRKIQQVDFGFSFGGPEAGPSDPTPSLFPDPAKSLPAQPVPNAATPLSLKTSQPESQIGSHSKRTPGGSRNNIPQRDSTYDIPLDEEPSEPRSNKRRRINPSSEKSGIPSRQNAQISGSGASNTAQNGATAPNEAPATQNADMSLDVNNGTNRLVTGSQADIHEQPPQTGTQSSRADAASQMNTEAFPRKSRSPQAPLQETQPIVESTNSTSGKQNKQKNSSPPQAGKSSPKQSKGKNARKQVKDTTRVSTGGQTPKTRISQPRPTSDDASNADLPEANDVTENSRREPEPEIDSGNVAQNEDSSQRPPQVSKMTQGNKSRPDKSKNVPPRATKETVPDVETQTEPTNTQSKDPRGKRLAGNAQSSSRKPINRNTQTRSELEPEPENATELPESSKPRREKPGKKGKKTAEPKSTARKEQLEAEADPDSRPGPSRSRRSRADKKGKRAAEPESPDTNTEERPIAEKVSQPEPGQPQQSEPQAEPGPSKSRAAKRGNRTKRTTELESTGTEEQPETEAVQEQRRKPREPRGETVPVTVHRLVNHEALGAIDAAVGSGDEDEASADQSLNQQTEKLPNRSGVNPADVLGQICRETLEKTLTTLQNGISNETNTQRRAEWSRKRKAVEAFGAELDSRLLDLSEMLDSNFMLGVQLKKSKRDMMDLRGRLYKVRQERESIALQMDAVRGKHMEEETAKVSRTTINNSLHSLDLALDRSQNRDSPTTDPSSADLEFMLRTVADDVSCRAPGAHGGLLNQIRAFNAQLETTAQRLERQ